MQSAPRIAVAVVFFTSALVSAYHSSAKLRRDGVLNLYPFPRVGRASRHTWQVPIPPHNDLYLDYEPLEKRQLYAFPRVGRNDLSLLRMGPIHAEQIPMPARRSETSGMWFGPRIGRSFKSEDDDTTFQNEGDRSDPEQIEAVHEEREKRQIKQD